MDDVFEMEPYDVWMHAKLEEEERMLDVDKALDEVSQVVDGWIRESRG